MVMRNRTVKQWFKEKLKNYTLILPKLKILKLSLAKIHTHGKSRNSKRRTENI